MIDPGYTDAENMSESAGTTTPDQDQTDLSEADSPGFIPVLSDSPAQQIADS